MSHLLGVGSAAATLQGVLGGQQCARPWRCKRESGKARHEGGSMPDVQSGWQSHGKWLQGPGWALPASDAACLCLGHQLQSFKC